MARVYEYENCTRIYLHDAQADNRITAAEVVQGIRQLYAGTPLGCLCWLAGQGDRKALAQLHAWRMLQEHTSSGRRIIGV